MLTSSLAPRVVIVSSYFGALPAYFWVWLETCRRNEDYRWLFATDQSLDDYDVPPNVLVQRMTLTEIRGIFSVRLRTNVELSRPYKICDFRPFFWILLDHLGVEYTHWGYSDIDIIYGRLGAFLNIELLARYQRMFESGHFSIYRNSRLAKSMAFSERAPFDWKTVLTSARSFGFDEHSGVNLAWAAFPELWWLDAAAIYDIEPCVRSLTPASGVILPKKTFVTWQQGRLTVTESTAVGGITEREVMAVHFQKRPITVAPGIDLGHGFRLLPSTIAPLNAGDGARVLDRWHSDEINNISVRERLFLVRNRLRKSRLGNAFRRLRGGRS